MDSSMIDILQSKAPDLIVDGVELYEVHPSLGLLPGKYFVSRDGQVYSIAIHRFLSGTSDKDGYQVMNLKRADHRRGLKTAVAKVVLWTFRGAPPEDMKVPTCEHIDGNRTNNNIKNLKWLERSINCSVRVNTLRGEACRNSVLTEPQVHEICRLLTMTKMSYRKIALRFGVSIYTIVDIHDRRSWNHIGKDYDFDQRNRLKTDPRLSEYPIILSIKDVEKILNVCKNTVKKKLKSKQIYSYKEGHYVRIPKIALIEYMEQKGIKIDK